MDFLTTYLPAPSEKELATELSQIQKEAEGNYTPEVLLLALGCIDLTTLNNTDTEARARLFAHNVNHFEEHFEDCPNVAAICVSPNLVTAVRNELNDSKFPVAAVVGGFPASQTLLEVKLLETKLAVEAGASEVDMVISVGVMKSGNYQVVFDEVKAIKSAAGKAHLKVILETGALSNDDIWKASLLVMEAGADFIKTSTGKLKPAATPEAALIMCHAINAYYDKTARQVGFKPAGGIQTGPDAATYINIVQEVLGEKWLTPQWFRIGASSLANNLLSELNRMNGKDEPIFYF